MSPKHRYLSKSRFKLASECPTKLFFTGKPEFGNNNNDNTFLKALSEGGFQVGELARLYFKGGTAVDTLDTDDAVAQTTELLKHEDIIIYEPAIVFENLIVRVDILVKRGHNVELIEVKAKSFDPTEEDPFYKKRTRKDHSRQFKSEWKPYLLDIAFQTYVAAKAFPHWKISSFLMLANKNAKATVDGLNQKFLLTQDNNGRTKVVTSENHYRADIGAKILCQIPVNEEVAILHNNAVGERSFAEMVAEFSRAYRDDKMIPPVIGKQCKTCEFRIDEKKKSAGEKSGFEVCWTQAANLKPRDFAREFIFNVWSFRNSQQCIEDGRYFIDEISELDIQPAPRNNGEAGLSISERQWLQIEKSQKNDSTPYIDEAGIASEMRQWRYPLHFIDFETTMVAIPFHAGRRPYEQIAFQFSHHVVTSDGKIEHRAQYINTERGHFPNFDFVRALRTTLSEDDGTIFRFAAHENTVLCQIYEQLRESEEKDREVLMNWIRTITTSTGDSVEKWSGARNMVDMCELVKKFYYHPQMGGSNSIKKVLPAILSSSEYLQAKYSSPNYGGPNGIISKNFTSWQWVKKNSSGSVTDPYRLLPPVFSDIDLEAIEQLITDTSIADGGTAMTAYARMQFTEMSDIERNRVTEALLRYCELDTFAMVLIYEFWKSEIENRKNEAA